MATEHLPQQETTGDGLRYRVVIVKRPAGWVPQHPLDPPPPGAEVVQRIPGPVSSEFARHYNAASLDDHGTTWALLEPAASSP